MCIFVVMFSGERELRCVKRKLLLEALEKELPIGTVRYSSKVVSIEESGYFKLVHLADGTILKTKVKRQLNLMEFFSPVSHIFMIASFCE